MPTHKNLEYAIAGNNAQVAVYGPVDEMARLAERINIAAGQESQNTPIDKETLALMRNYQAGKIELETLLVAGPEIR